MTHVVEAYAGSTYPEQPRAFQWENQRYEVQAILDRRREPAGVGFLVRCDPGNALFDLFYNSIQDKWHIQPKGLIETHERAETDQKSQGV
jgi:hypothetical protein